jgi:hypothetical protein
VDAQVIAAADPELVEHGGDLSHLERATCRQFLPEASFVLASVILIDATRLIEQRCHHIHRLLQCRPGTYREARPTSGRHEFVAH